MQIGPHEITGQVIVAPMAGVTDRPFRKMCKRLGADLAVSEMISANSQLHGAEATLRRADHAGETSPISIQIAGADPKMLARAARFNVDLGAQIIDINMGCPAKKVCKRLAGSALLRDEVLVGQILDAVVAAVDVPVTLKIRTGWSPEFRNGVRIAQIAQSAGVQALAVHGRTRECKFQGEAEYGTIAAIKKAVSIPVFANGDIDTPEKAREVLAFTGADAVMIGRAAQGRPWIFGDIAHFLRTGEKRAAPGYQQRRNILQRHVAELHEFYDEYVGVRVARKHIGWAAKEIVGAAGFRARIYKVEDCKSQLQMIGEFFDSLSEGEATAMARRRHSAKNYRTSDGRIRASAMTPGS